MSTNLTNDETPTKKRKTLHDIPKKAERYVKKYASLRDDTALRDTQKFSLRDGVWQEWDAPRLLRFVGYMQCSTNLASFAHQEDIPVEEVQEVFNQTICEDIYRLADMAVLRLKRRMQAQIELLQKKGEPIRKWTDEDIEGELYSVGVGNLVLISPKKTEVLLEAAKLNESDLGYCRKLFTPEEWERLHDDAEQRRKQMVFDIDDGEDVTDKMKTTRDEERSIEEQTGATSESVVQAVEVVDLSAMGACPR